jgi:ferredoxin
VEVKMAVYVVSGLCLGCGACADICPKKAIAVLLKRARVDENLCDDCEECIFICPNGAITGG